PANSPNVITVGGIDDGNLLGGSKALYHSTFGGISDYIMKPELLAHAIWIAAPILPGTAQAREALILYSLLALDDDELMTRLPDVFDETGLDQLILNGNNIIEVRESIQRRVQTCKFISPHYMHVDGTSFAAPIVTSVIAQMLEANPKLDPS